MPNYDFKQLSSNDFEYLSRDLIQARDNIVLESFKTGRDLGIDFKHAFEAGNVIVQCKHYVGTGFSGLMTDLRKEVPKVGRLAPSRYILVTSVGLTPPNKTTIQELFGRVLSTGDIVGQDDLNNLLGLHSDIEQQHYKLWLASRAVLDRVIHNASLIQSEFDAECVHRDISRYVQSDAFPRACEMLNREHVAIISGAPGVGKTSLAKMLLYRHLEQGYEPVSILTDFQSGRERYQSGRKQIFYFDDFLGATFLGDRALTFTRNEDRAILDFVEIVRRSPTARLVMTTREHILNQAMATSEKLNHSQLRNGVCVLEIRDYDEMQRARILYNHIYFSDLPSNYRNQLLANRFYKTIVQHKKFNPRLIDWLSSFQRIQSVPCETYQQHVRNLLADPSPIWRYAFDQQISDAARSVMFALYTYQGKCGQNPLCSAFQSVHSLRAERYGFKTSPSDWRLALGELRNSFIRLNISNQIEVIDPSVLDLLNAIVRQDSQNALDMIEGSVRFEQARRIWVFSLANGSEDVLDYLNREHSRVAAAFERLFTSPRQAQKGQIRIFFDDSLELRVSTLIQVAEKSQSAQAIKIVNSAMAKLVLGWESEIANIVDGVSLLTNVEESSLSFQPSKGMVRDAMIRALFTASALGCGSYELRALLDAVKPEEIDDAIYEKLKIAVGEYRANYFSDELRNCKSEFDFDNLEQNLVTISQKSQLNFTGAIESVHADKSEFEEHQSQYEDYAYDQWKDQRLEIQTDERAIDDLFDSLND